MNAFTKMVLIPEDEYFRLKSATRDHLSHILDRPLPPQMLHNQINRQLDTYHRQTSQPVTQMNRQNETVVENKYDVKPINPITYLNDTDLSGEFADVSSDPAVLKVGGYDILGHKHTPRGRIINSERKVIRGSNVDKVMDFLQSSTPKPGPSGYKTTARELVRLGKEDMIINPKGKIVANQFVNTNEQLKNLLQKAEDSAKQYKMKQIIDDSEEEWDSIKDW